MLEGLEMQNDETLGEKIYLCVTPRSSDTVHAWVVAYRSAFLEVLLLCTFKSY